MLRESLIMYPKFTKLIKGNICKVIVTDNKQIKTFKTLYSKHFKNYKHRDSFYDIWKVLIYWSSVTISYINAAIVLLL